MCKSIILALAAGILMGKILYQLKVRMGWKVVLALLALGIGCSLIYIFPERYYLGGIFILVMGFFALLSSAKEFSGAVSWRSCVCGVAYLVLLSFADEGKEYVSRTGWDECRKLFVLPFLGYVIGGGIIALRPLGWGRITGLWGIIIMLFINMNVIKSGFAIVPAIIGCFVFYLSIVGWNFASKRILPHVAAAVYTLTTLMMLILFFM